MDLSAFIFVALAVAWAVYLVPKALKHHDDVVRSRSVDRFSHTMRVLARREPVNRRNARLVVTPARVSSAPVVTAKASTPTEPVARVAAPARATAPAPVRDGRGRREAANRAARKRRNVLATILLGIVATVAVAAFGVIGWAWTAIPGGLLVAWLVACRLMVRRERSAWLPARRSLPVESVESVEDDEVVVDDLATAAAAPAAPAADVDAMEDTSSMVAIPATALDPTLWDPVPVTLPTYVTKPAAARRTVRTIALDDSGVWTSGRTEGDAQIAREAHAADKAARTRKAEGDDHRAVGS
ncbi:hypothetical protein H5V45_07795 [Nocardioides sp. KIGAM211]|uniref:Uncharacterized protein n=1 Tax=Nocardioides luti TaxID=2761101 RepID=A0A7X0VAS0_9ACTN|nr:hypothetical protein [Nocardioides luti]MBB6627222.1 hypothetical protein [Nocardioides luti]